MRDRDGCDDPTPALARVYDYVLGGSVNFRTDRELAERILQVLPGYQTFARANRAFLRRAVLHLLDQGITQFLDLGSGIATVGAVHEITRTATPFGRVLYVDHDSVAVEHSKILTETHECVDVIQGDLRDPDDVLERARERRSLDFNRPIGLLMVAVLHCVPEEDAPELLLATYHDRLPPGSKLVASHASGDSLDVETTSSAVEGFANAGITILSRTRERFRELLGPWLPDANGVLPVSRWRSEPADNTPADSLGYAVTASSTRPASGAG